MTGLVLRKPLPTYPDGFPADLVQAFEQAIGRKVIGNKAASGTEIIQELGEEHSLVRVVDPVTKQEYVLVPADLFSRLQSALSDIDPREAYPAIDRAFAANSSIKRLVVIGQAFPYHCWNPAQGWPCTPTSTNRMWA